MTISLKAQNKLALWTVVAANVAIYVAAAKHQSLTTGNWSALVTSLPELIPAGIGLVIVGVLNALLSADFKAILVFWRRCNPLPGCEAFTKLASLDTRVDTENLERVHGPLPTDPVEQNRLWYKLYRPLSNEPPVAQAHREYLFTRDYACLALMMTAVLGGAGAFQIRPWWAIFIYVMIPFLQFVAAATAARNHGRRLVTTVLAITSTQEKGAPQ